MNYPQIIAIKNYPLTSLTENITFSKSSIDITKQNQFYIIFPKGFKVGEKAKFGYDSTIIETSTSSYPFRENQRAICRDGDDNIHVVFRHNTTSIYYAKSSNEGSSWSVNESFYGGTSTATSTKFYPHVSCDGDNITVSFEDTSADDVAVAISEDNGVTWTWENPVTSGVKYWTNVERRGSRIYVIFQTTGYDIKFINSTDGGNTWGASKVIMNGITTGTNREYYSEQSFVVNGNGGNNDKLFVVTRYRNQFYIPPWFDESSYYISFTNSSDSGNNWLSPKTITTGWDKSYDYPSITFNDSELFVVTRDNEINKVIFTNSTDEGTTWTQQYNITEYADAFYSSVTIDNDSEPTVFMSHLCIHIDYWNIGYKNNSKTSGWQPTKCFYNLTEQTSDDQLLSNTKYNYNGNRIEIVWRNGSSSPYNIMYDFIQFPAPPPPPATPIEIDLYLNGTQGNVYYLNNTYANFTVTTNVTALVNLTTNISGWIDQSDESPLYNTTLITCSVNNTPYNITAFAGNVSYSGDPEIHYAYCYFVVIPPVPRETYYCFGLSNKNFYYCNGIDDIFIKIKDNYLYYNETLNCPIYNDKSILCNNIELRFINVEKNWFDQFIDILSNIF